MQVRVKIMRIRVKLFIPLITLFFCFSYLNFPVRADNLSDAITAYSMEDYNKALTLIIKEISEKPDDIEAYKWLGKTYEALFDIEKAMQAYKTYENMKKNMYAKGSVSPIPKIEPGKTPQPVKSIEAMPKSPMPSMSPGVKPSISPNPNTVKPAKTPMPSVKPSPLPSLASSLNNKIATKTKPKPFIKKPVPVPTPTVGTLTTQYDGWKSINIISLLKEKKIKIIPRDTMDLEEVDDYAGSDREFILIECAIKYNKDIIIKSNSSQITLVDQNDRSYYLYAMSTYKFKYGGNQASKKMEALQAADYFQLSLKDSRPTITFVFKVESNNSVKELKIQGYKNLDLTSFNA